MWLPLSGALHSTPLTEAPCNFSTASSHTHPSSWMFWPLAPTQRANYNQVISQHKTPLRLSEFCYNRISHSLIITNSFYLYWSGAHQNRTLNLTNPLLPSCLQKSLPHDKHSHTPHHTCATSYSKAQTGETWEVPPIPYSDLHTISPEASLG